MSIKFIVAASMVAAALVVTGCNASFQKPKIGIILSKLDNGFITSLQNAMFEADAIIGTDDMTMIPLDSKGDQNLQNKQIDDLIGQKVQVIAVNLIKRTAALDIIGKARGANIPLIFFNLEPFPADMTYYDRVYYVGSIAEMAGGLQAEIALDYWRANAGLDRNKDGIIQYVTLMGETDHPDARTRTASVKKFLDLEGQKNLALTEVTAHWSREDGKKVMLQLLKTYKDQIEMVFANNDYMAIGAIDALQSEGYFDSGRFIPVLGVDATPLALDAIEKGTMLGTVLNDVRGQGTAIMELAHGLARGQNVMQTSIAKVTRSDGSLSPDGRYVLVPYRKVTRENFREFKRDAKPETKMEMTQ